MKRILKEDNIYFRYGGVLHSMTDKDEFIIGYKGVGEATVPTSLANYINPHSVNNMNLVHFIEQCVIHSQYIKFEMI